MGHFFLESMCEIPGFAKESRAHDDPERRSELESDAAKQVMALILSRLRSEP